MNFHSHVDICKGAEFLNKNNIIITLLLQLPGMMMEKICLGISHNRLKKCHHMVS